MKGFHRFSRTGARSINYAQNRQLKLEEHVKVEHESPIVVPKERAILWISDVGVHFERVEVVGQIRDRT